MRTLLIDWGSFYANHAAARTLITFAHIGGLVAAGGAAVTADRGLLFANRREPESAPLQLSAARNTHALVLWGLGFVTLSGLLLFAADVDTFWASRVFWTKMALIVLLIANGTLLMWSERRATAGDASAWPALRATAAASILLWMLTTLAGAALLNI